jgi:hypothetical protein
MIIRSFAAVCGAVAAFSTALAPTESFARARGVAAASAPAVRAALPRAAPRPNFHRGNASQMPAKSLVAGPSSKSVPGAKHHYKPDHMAPHRRHTRFFARRLPLGGIGIFYGPIYGPALYEVPIPVSETADDAMPVPQRNGGGNHCRSRIVVVPSEAGGERPITITECNLP